MARSSDDVLTAIQANLMPDGWAWNHDAASNAVQSFRPLADFVAGFEAAAEAQLDEAVPLTAQQLVGAYERVLGADPCLGDPSTLPFDALRMSISTRWTQPTDVSIPGLIALAAGYGVGITITEVVRKPWGGRVCGDPWVPNPQQFTWVVSMPAARVVPFVWGGSRWGTPFGTIERNTQIECVISRVAPSHTVPVFSYAEA